MGRDLEERLLAIQKWPRMVLLEQRFGALVAYLEGFAAGSESGQLEGFQGWVAAQILGRRSSFHWAVIVAGRQNDRLLDGSVGLEVLSAEESDAASSELISLMLRFLREGSQEPTV